MGTIKQTESLVYALHGIWEILNVKNLPVVRKFI